jgi:hypothetical protein
VPIRADASLFPIGASPKPLPRDTRDHKGHPNFNGSPDLRFHLDVIRFSRIVRRANVLPRRSILKSVQFVPPSMDPPLP